MSKKKKKISGKWTIAIICLVILGIFLVINSLNIKNKIKYGNEVAIIHVNGPITAGQQTGFLTDSVASSTRIIEDIQKANNNPNIKAILFEINSPGGTAVASKEIADEIKRTEKYTIALIREVGASGAYWIASSCDKIIANDLSIVGSIGVIGSYLDFSGLLDNYNITYQRLVSGQYKDMGSPFKKLTNDEKQKFQGQIDSMHDYFTKQVAINRNMPIDQITPLATGEVFVGFNALEVGLVDVLGDKYTAKAVLKEHLDLQDITFVEYKKKTSILDTLSNMFSKQSFFVGKGIGSSILNLKNTQYEVLI